jgi:rhodanese-related sulfurtransferase
MNGSRKPWVVGALLLGLLTAVAGEPRPGPGADEITAMELAGWLRQQRPGLQLIDLRPADTMQGERLPGARALDQLDPQALEAAQIIVLVADGDVDAADAQALRQRWPKATLRRLHGGLRAWNAEVMAPVIRADAPAWQQADFAGRAELSRYFGGTPQVLDAAALAARPRSRQGC